jgi:Na+-driven multidrug efflux pump
VLKQCQFLVVMRFEKQCRSKKKVERRHFHLRAAGSVFLLFQFHARHVHPFAAPGKVRIRLENLPTIRPLFRLGATFEEKKQTLGNLDEKDDFFVSNETVSTLAQQTTTLEISISSLDSQNSAAGMQTIEAPTTQSILRFAIPAIGIWICSPLLSMIDTSTVGLICGTAQQAALNPAVAVSDYSARIMSFLYTGTTNVVAVAQETDRGVQHQPETKKALLGALRLSLRVGLGLCIFLLILSTPMLKSLVGNASLNPEVLRAAQKYAYIRALGMPAAAMIGSLQAACLGMRDVKSPLYVTLMAAVVNLVADIILVPRAHPWIGGAAGAAWATILSQYVAVLMYLRWLCTSSSSQREENRVSKTWATIRNKLSTLLNPRRRGIAATRLAAISLPTSINDNKPKLASDDDSLISVAERKPSTKVKPSTSTRGFLKGDLRVQDLWEKRNENDQTSRQYIPYVVPVTTTQMGRCSVYVAMGNVVSSTLGTTTMAANQILTAFFYALIPLADSLSQTAQVMLPRIILATSELKDKPKEKYLILESTLKNFLKAALLCGSVLSGIVACIPFLSSALMTSDPLVSQLVNSVVPIHLLIFSLHGIFCASEGILMAQKDLGYLGKMYALYFVVVPALMMRLKRQGSNNLQLKSIWLVFLGYQLFRISAWVGRVLWLLRKSKVQADAAADDQQEDTLPANTAIELAI